MSKEKLDKKKKEKDEVSIDWFEDHEPYSDEDSSEEDIEEIEEILEDETPFKNRIGHFLANQRKDVSLERMLEIPTDDLGENFPTRKTEEVEEENKIDYLTRNEEENKMKYQSVSPDTPFSKPEMSSSQRILEEQKFLYKRIESVSDNLKFGEESQTKFVRPEDTMKKDYLSKRRIQ